MTGNDKPADTGTYSGLETAVIGIAVRFPGASDIHRFWENLTSGIETITFFTPEELLASGVEPGLIDDPAFVPARGFLEGCEYFDAAFFGYLPDEARVMDPQTRLFHECVWEALEDAGIDPSRYDGLIGLYAGAGTGILWQAYAMIALSSTSVDEFSAGQFRDKDFLPTLISYRLNLRGPSISIQTACSTSLVAVHLAAQALVNGECDIALAGGVSLGNPTQKGYRYQEGMINSSDGHCRAFDEKASGTIGGMGAGVVVLKPLDNAMEQDDHIYAVIKGASINNDGIRKVGFAAPSAEGQAEAIQNALDAAEVECESITYIETHGTGTPLGDPIEIEALNLVFGNEKEKTCALGSLKTNMGHLDAAAGVAGLIKTVLALYHRQIPPSLHFQTPNARINFDNGPFYINTKLKSWENPDFPLRAGVSAFGIGGTNAHVILEEPPKLHSDEHKRNQYLVILSAKTSHALERSTIKLGKFLEHSLELPFADITYTLQTGRQEFPHRLFTVCSSTKEATDILSSPSLEKAKRFIVDKEKCSVVFMFPGQGAQYVNMARELYDQEKDFQKTMDHCFAIADQWGAGDLKKILFGANKRGNTEPGADEIEKINETAQAQPLLFILEYALASLLMKWGIKPDIMIGHSIGEYTAACLSGAIKLEEVLPLVLLRGKLMQSLPAGTMLSVPLSSQQLAPILENYPQLALAAINAPDLCVVSGDHDTIHSLEAVLTTRGYKCRALHTSHAFHSAMMDPILQEFASAVAKITCQEPLIPYISNLTGEPITFEDISDHSYWSRHLRNGVLFSHGIETILKQKHRRFVFIEVGPGRTLSTFIHRHLAPGSRHKTINLVRHPGEKTSDMAFLLEKIGECWLYGITPDWKAFYGEETRRKVSLPTYSFEKIAYSLGVDPVKMIADMILLPSLTKKTHEEDWFYVPTWKRSLLLDCLDRENEGNEAMDWLVFSSDTDLGTKLVELLRAKNRNMITVNPGSHFHAREDNDYVINPSSEDDYKQLFTRLISLDKMPAQVLHLWNLATEQGDLSIEKINHAQERGFYSVLNISRAWQHLGILANKKIMVVSSALQNVLGKERVCPGKATLLGPLTVISQEYPSVICRSIDLAPSETMDKEFLEQLYREITSDSGDKFCAYREGERWVQDFIQVKPSKQTPGSSSSLLKKQGVYIITGGMGHAGLVIARYLLKKLDAKIVLTGRTPLPPVEEWQTFGENEAKTSVNKDWLEKIKEIIEWLQPGATLVYFPCDVSQPTEVSLLLEKTRQRFGTVDGIFHTAGVIEGKSFQPVHLLTQEQCQEQFTAKVYGLWALKQALAETPVDFCLLTSSLSTVLGGFGFTAYAAANSFMDYFAMESAGKKEPTRWISLDLDGLALVDQAGKKMAGQEFSITAIELEKLLDRVLTRTTLPRWVISTADLTTRLQQWVHRTEEEDQVQPGTRERDEIRLERPVLTTTYAPPVTSTEKKLADIWQDFFGIGQIGIMDNFFELGGDSLKAMTVSARIQQQLKTGLSLTDFFAQPTIKELAKQIDRSAPQVLELIEKTEDQDYYMVSPAQRRLYLLQQVDPGNTVYNITQVLSLEKNTPIAFLEQVFKKLIQRHESLRTSFLLLDDMPVQQVHSTIEWQIETWTTPSDKINAGSFPPGFVRPFDLACAPLLRVGVVRTDETQPTDFLLVDVHHIIADGVSFNVLERDFAAFSRGEELAPLPLQYRDIAQWQASTRYREFIKKQEAYWLGQFSPGKGELPVLELPLDFRRPTVQGFAGATLSFYLSPGDTQGLLELSRRTGVTLYMTLLALFNILLARLSNQEDIVIGTATAGRNRADLEPLMGMFVNTLALRNQPQFNRLFLDFLQEVKVTTLAAFDNQDYPFEELVEKITVVRDASRNPVFDVMFSLQSQEDYKSDTRDLPVIDPEKMTLSSGGIAKFDITFYCTELAAQLYISLEYCTNLFTHETMKRLAGYWQHLLHWVLQNNHEEIGSLEILAPAEKHDLLYRWNQADTPFPGDVSIGHLFEEQVTRVPDHAAVVSGNRVLTYRKLAGQVRHVSTYLKTRAGLQPGEPVAVLTSRSFAMISALFGIMEAGGICLPASRLFPGERVRRMINDANAHILINQGLNHEFVANLTSQCPTLTCIINLDEEGQLEETLEYEKEEPGPLTVKGHDLAYIIYTSGSTGTPKGSLLTHKNLIRIVKNTNYIEIDERDRILQLSDFSFDASMFDIYGALTNGATLVLVTQEQLLDVSLLSRLILKQVITIFFATTSLFNTIVEVGPPTFQYARKIIFGGERGSVEHSYKASLYTGKDRVLNAYGPTETSIYATYFPVDQLDHQAMSVPIGYAVANTSIYILNKRLNPVPLNVVGEIVIGGSGVSRGYLNNPALTAEKFIPHPFQPGEMVYRSGDLGRRRPDGILEFSGRVDQQVKVRGFRIEPGEIETAILASGMVKECFVGALEDATGSRFLCAYLVPVKKTGDKGSNELTPKVFNDELKKLLNNRLPEYMIPTYFQHVEKIPLNTSGKVDRKALPKIVMDKPALYIAPANDLEEKLALIFSRALFADNRPIGRDDHFFHLGGHSLKATVVVSRIHKELDVKVSLGTLFAHPTICGLAEAIRQIKNLEHFTGITPVEKKEYYPVTPAQQRFYFLYRLHPESLAFNMPTMIPLDRDYDKEKLETTFIQLCLHHENLRTAFVLIDGQPVQRVYDSVPVHIDYCQDESRLVRPFDLTCAPLLRVAILESPGQAPALLVDMHHIISDGTSQGILNRDFKTLYSGGTLAHLELQYKDFAVWLHDRLEQGDDEMKKHEAFWLQYLGGRLTVLEIPTDFPRPRVRQTSGAHFTFTLGTLLTQQLKQLNHETGTTLYMILMAAFNVLLSHYSGQEDILVGSPIAGRYHADLENIIGLVIGSIMVRNHAGKNKPFVSFLEEVKSNTLAAYEHQAYPFEKLLEKLEWEDLPGHEPLTNMALIVQNLLEVQPGEEQVGTGSTGSKEPQYSSRHIEVGAKLDITLYGAEQGDNILLWLEYCTALFKPATIERMARHLVTILQEIVRHPDMALADIDMVSAEEKIQRTGNTPRFYRLTHPQKRIYDTEQVFSGTACNTLAFTLRFPRLLNKNQVEQTITWILTCHDALRLRVLKLDFQEDPVQYLAAPYPYKLEMIDFSQQPAAEREDKLRHWRDEQVKRPFHIQNQPLCEFIFFKTGETSSGLLIKFHHLVFDGWCVVLFIREFERIYQLLTVGEAIAATGQPSYLDYLKDEREYLSSPRFQEHRAYWLEQLLPLPQPVSLSFGYHQAALSPGKTRGQVQKWALPDDLRTAIFEYSHQHQTSVFKLILAALSLYISRVTGSLDIVVGGAGHNRSRERQRQTMGMVASTFPLRIKIDEHRDFHHFVAQTGAQLNQVSKEYQAYPFDLLLEELRQVSNIEPQLLEVNLVGHGEIPFHDVIMEHHFAGDEPTPLVIHINDKQGVGVLELEWVSQIAAFTPDDIEQMHDSLSTILKNGLENPGIPLAQVELVSEKQKGKILYQFNDTVTQPFYPLEKLVYEFFSDQVKKTPQAVALVARSYSTVTGPGLTPNLENLSSQHPGSRQSNRGGLVRLTYEALHHQAEQWAQKLRKAGVGVDDIVAIQVEPSLEMVIGLWAILKAGGAYLPIAADYPAERVEYMLKDSAARVMMSDRVIEKEEPGYLKKWGGVILTTVYLNEPTATSLPPLQPGNQPLSSLAYIIYTSGSTGRPKGVLVEHGQLLNYINAFIREFPINSRDVSVQQAAFTFDAFVEEFYPVLLSGGCLVVPQREEVQDIARFRQFISRHQVTFTSCSPLMLDQLNREDLADIASIRIFISGGDRLQAGYIDRLVQRPGTVVYNTYGPTESTVCATYHRCLANDRANVPIGRPIANYRLFVLDNCSRLLPIGVPGELCITGPGITRGYLNLPVLTAEKFVLVPGYDQNQPGLGFPAQTIMYRTGDLVRWLENGELEFLGRIDRQVKIRGYRIELGEIENRLDQHEAISRSVVVERTGKDGDAFLCAYYVRPDGQKGKEELPVSVLREFLSLVLPDYMIPARFVVIEQIPLTPGNKVDTRALPDPLRVETGLSGYTSPRTPLEHQLIDIWHRSLGVDKERIGIDTNFFDLGGHSLKAASVLAAIHKHTHVQVPLGQLFNAPTIRELALFIQQAGQDRFMSIEPVERQQYYPVSSAQKRMYILRQIEAEATAYNMPLAFSLGQTIEPIQLELALRGLIQRHESLRTSFLDTPVGPVQKVHEADTLVFNLEYFHPSTREAVGEVVKRFVRSFALTRAPLLRVGVVKTSFGDLLLTDMHHIICDGVSVQLLKRDFVALYQGESLPPLRIQYKDYASWLNQTAQQAVIREQESYWLKEFSGELPALDLPLDYSRPEMQRFEGAREVAVIDAGEFQGLKFAAASLDATIYMVLLAGLNLLLSRLSGSEDILIGTPVSGRRHADLESIIGMFVNTLVLRNAPAREKSVVSFTREVREKCLEAFENQDFPFEDLVNKVAVQRDMGRNPLFDVMFIFQDIAGPLSIDAETAAPSSASDPIDFNLVAKFDLTFQVIVASDGLILDFQYCKALFKADTIQRFIQYFKRLTAIIASGEEQAIGQVEILSIEERRELLFDFNHTRVDYPADQTIIDLFTRQVEQTPDKMVLVGSMAVSLATEPASPPFSQPIPSRLPVAQVTFRHLEKVANLLAGVLIEKGVEVDSLCAILLDRSLEMVVAMLGVLKAGAAFLPIDPTYPWERIRYMLLDSAARVLIMTRGQVQGDLVEGNPGQQVVFLDDVLSHVHVSFPGQVRGPVSVDPANFAYVIYTSGTTGRPKGTVVQHRALVNLCTWHSSYYQLTPLDRSTQYAAIGFDAAVCEIFPYITKGVELHILPDDLRLDIPGLKAYFQSRRITVSFLPTQFGQQFMEDTVEVPSLRALLTAGDQLVRFVKRSYRLYNNYGPTENTVAATVYPVDYAETNIPIGQPIANNQIYILDPGGWRLQPVGVPGELCIAGDSVALGYLNRPDLTVEKFIGNFVRDRGEWASLLVGPLSASGKILYKTGDLASWRTDGNIRFHGRLDRQIKIRGFRVELGEIETRLLAESTVSEAVVTIQQDLKGGKVLTAYVVLKSNPVQPFAVERFKAYLAAELPPYMVPAFIINLERMPLTPNGKIDRKKLPAPEIQAGDKYAAPRNETEDGLVSIWADVLGVAKAVIGIDDNFFDLGGNSLKLINVRARLHEELQRDIPIVRLFTYPTVRGLSEHLVSGVTQPVVTEDRTEIIVDRRQKLMDRRKRR